jgi:hypothetical protein
MAAVLAYMRGSLDMGDPTARWASAAASSRPFSTFRF